MTTPTLLERLNDDIAEAHAETLCTVAISFELAADLAAAVAERDELRARIEGAPVASLSIESGHRFVLRDADPLILAMDGRRVALVPVDGEG